MLRRPVVQLSRWVSADGYGRNNRRRDEILAHLRVWLVIDLAADFATERFHPEYVLQGEQPFRQQRLLSRRDRPGQVDPKDRPFTVASVDYRATDRDAESVERGQRLTELLKQGQFVPMVIEEQVISLYAGTRGFLDTLPIARIGEFERRLIDALRAEGTILASIREKREIVKDVDDKLKAFMADFVKKFA